MVFRNRSGFTLIEVLLSLTLLGILMVTVLSLYQFNLLEWERDQDVIDVQDNLRTGLDCIAREARQAKNLHSGSSDNCLKFYTSDYQLISYFLEGTSLYRKTGSSVKQPVADNITRLQIQYGTGGLINIVMAGQTENTPEISYSTTVKIRTVSVD